MVVKFKVVLGFLSLKGKQVLEEIWEVIVDLNGEEV